MNCPENRGKLLLLKTLARNPVWNAAHRRLCRETRWTKLTESEYLRLIESFRAEGLDKPAFWMMERYWEPDRR